MKRLAIIVTALAGIFLGSFSLVGAVSTFITSQGGIGTTTPSGILYGDNGATTHLNTVTIGSNLTFSGGTLSASVPASTFPVSTSTNETAGQIAYWTSNSASPALLGKVATTSITCSGNISCTGFTGLGSASTITFTGILGIANGGTATSTGGFTNGVEYYDGTELTNTSLFRFDGTNLGIGTSTPGSLLSIGNAAGWNFRTGTTTAESTGGIDLLGGGCFSVGGTCLQTIIQAATAFKSAANYAATTTLAGTPSYNNGVAGVGATLTEVGNGTLYVDGANPSVGQRILVKNQADQTQNGVYTVTATGSAIAVYVLTRSTDFNSPNDVYAGVTVPVISGTANAGTSWVQTTTGAITIGSSNIVFAEASASGGGIASITTTWPIITSGGSAPTLSFGWATTSQPSSSNLVVSNGTNGFYGVATTTLAGGGPITVSNSPVVLGASGAVLGCNTASGSQAGCLSSTDWTTFNTKQASGFQVATTSGIAISQLAYYTSTTGTIIGGVATTTPSIGSVLTYSGTLGALVGGASGTFGIANSAVTNAMLANSTISGISLGTNLNSLTKSGTTLSGTSYNGSAAVSDWAINLANSNNWTPNTTGFGTTTQWATLSVSTTTALSAYLPLFSVGSSTQSSILNVFGNGYVGIGTTTPFAPLSVQTPFQANAVSPIFVLASTTGQTYLKTTNGGQTSTCEYDVGVATSTAFTLNFATTCNTTLFRMGVSAVTITVTGGTAGDTKRIIVCNPNGTAGALSWASSAAGLIQWPAGTIPTQTTTANKCDVYSFLVTQATSTAATSIKYFGAGTTNF